METEVYNEILQAMESVGRGVGGNINNNIEQVEVNNNRVIWKDIESAFANRIRTGMVVNLLHHDLRAFLQDARDLIVDKLETTLQSDGNIKANVILTCKFIKSTANQETIETKTFNTKNEAILASTDISVWFNEFVSDRLHAKVEDFEHRDSGWSLLEIGNLALNINKYVPLHGGNGSTYTDLPEDIKKKKAVINILNEDYYCFLWSVIAAFHPAQDGRNVSRVRSYRHYSRVLNYDGIKFPMQLKDIPKFEKLNNLSINVYGIESEHVESDDELCEQRPSVIVPLYFSKENLGDSTIHLLMLEVQSADADIDDNIENRIASFERKFHFTLIKDLSRLVSSQISKHKTRKYFCDRCLCHFHEEITYEKHRRDRIQINKVRIELPVNDELKFKNFKYQEDVPFVVYADIECMLIPKVDESEEHILHSVAFYVHCAYNDALSRYECNRSDKCIDWFMSRLKSLAISIHNLIKSPVKMHPLTEQENFEYNTSKKCHICNKYLAETDKCRDHCHFTGKYRGPAHVKCNILYQQSHNIPIVFHNLSGYDSHFLIESVAKCFPGSVQLLPINKEKYIAFTKKVDETIISLRFIDSFRFMASSIEKLASYLNDADKVITRNSIADPQQFELVTRKGIFPYEYVDSWDKLNSTKLPAKKHFFSKLTNSDVSDDDYKHAERVWNTFGIQTLGEYSDLYLKTNALLLADIFQNFRKSCKQTYNLDPLHYYTAPGLAFDAMLKYTDVSLDLLSDPSMLLFFEKGIRGGVAQCSNRYARANNPFMGNEYNPARENSYIMYFDVNNLYGAAMSQYLPTGSFKWVNASLDFILNNPDDSPKGYILEVDLEYPKNLHEQYEDLPLCPEHFLPPKSTCTKLATTLYDKEKYVIHYCNLKQCIELGMSVKQVHRVLEFDQSSWLKSYIDLNTECRKKSADEFTKNFYKLMNNAVFGKTMENVRNHTDVRLVRKWEGQWGARSLIAKPNFHSCTVFGEDMVLIEMSRVKILFNKPIYVGYSILDLSKIIVYNFHYNYIKTNFTLD
ncbi:uncharacterized protein LOC106694097 [Microplitis demolitor]|uniref:uncharacterized protein LOC106694097 n=1 Tax=Microplitis demolitor TaxID=69319 RepID=UPI00235B6773|nr:uncharacterized protein LOC106694097 [Microplitis demolitor]